MAENVPVAPHRKLPVIPILIGAFQAPWHKRSRLIEVAAVPSIAIILISLYWNSFRAQSAPEALVWVLLNAMAFTPFAIACHRVLLLGETSLPRYGVMRWTTREFRFLWWLVAALGSAGFVIIMLVMMILGGTIVNAFDIPAEWDGWSWIGKICEALVIYGREAQFDPSGRCPGSEAYPLSGLGPLRGKRMAGGAGRRWPPMGAESSSRIGVSYHQYASGHLKQRPVLPAVGC